MSATSLQNHPSVEELFKHVDTIPLALFAHLDFSFLTDSPVFAPKGELSLPTPWNALLESYLDVTETLTEEIEKIEQAIEERAGSLKETQLLMSIPGLSYFTALTNYAELG